MILATKIEIGKWYYNVNMSLLGKYVGIHLYGDERLADGSCNFHTHVCCKNMENINSGLKVFGEWSSSNYIVDRMLEANCVWEVEDNDDLDLLANKLEISVGRQMWSYEDIRSKADGSLLIRKMEEL